MNIATEANVAGERKGQWGLLRSADLDIGFGGAAMSRACKIESRNHTKHRKAETHETTDNGRDITQ
jgi:hypothetical protein